MSELITLPELTKQECLLIVQSLQVYGREAQKVGRGLTDLWSLTNDEKLQPLIDEFKSTLTEVDQLSSKILNTI